MIDVQGFTSCPGCGRLLTASDVVLESEAEKLIHCIVCDYKGTVKKESESAGAIQEGAPIAPPASASVSASVPGDLPKSVGHWDPSGEGEQ
jgi:hypothetical protein